MKLSDVVSGAGLAFYAEVALLLFFIVFVIVGVRVMLTRGSSLERAARLPLDDEPAPTVSARTRTE